MDLRKPGLAAALLGAFLAGLAGCGFTDVATATPAHSDATRVVEWFSGEDRRSEAARRSTRGAEARPCILHRESRGIYTLPPNASGASGAYQFTQVAWDATARREGRRDLIGKPAYKASPADQTAMYFAAWRHGNGRFYWSARWGAPYACFPGDVRPMRSGG